MTLTATTPKVSYAGDGSTTAFSVTFVFWTADDLRVVHRDSDGVETVWTRGTQYTVTGGSGSTGTVTASTSPTDYTPASGETLVITSAIGDTQDTDIPNGGNLASASVEQQLDKIVRQVQQLQLEINRSFRVPETDIATDLVAPVETTRASKVFGFDSSGDVSMLTAQTAGVASFTHDATGGISRTVEDRLRDTAHLGDFEGADLNAKFGAALASGVGGIIIPDSFTMTTARTVPDNTRIHGIGFPTITKGFNGDLLTLGTTVHIEGISFAGAGGTYTGRCFVIGSDNSQRIINCDVLNFNGYCLEVTTNAQGSLLHIQGGTWTRTTSTDYAIKYPDTDSSGVHRSIISVDNGGGSRLVDVAGGQVGSIIDCNNGGIKFGTGSGGFFVMASRIGDLTVLGTQHMFVGCSFPNTVTVGPSASSVLFVGCTGGNLTIATGSSVRQIGNNWTGTITDNAQAASHILQMPDGTIKAPRFVRGFGSATAPTSIATAGVATYTAAQILSGIIVRDCAGSGRTDTFPTAALLVAALSSPMVGDVHAVTIINGSDGAETITLAAGSGGGFDTNQTAGSRVIPQNSSKTVYVRLTNVTASSEAYVMYA